MVYTFLLVVQQLIILQDVFCCPCSLRLPMAFLCPNICRLLYCDRESNRKSVSRCYHPYDGNRLTLLKSNLLANIGPDGSKSQGAKAGIGRF